MKRLLCMIGLHDWRPAQMYEGKKRRHCCRCGKRQFWFVPSWDRAEPDGRWKDEQQA